MTLRPRVVIFCGLAALLVPFIWSGLAQLPAFGHYQGPYGDLVNTLAGPARHVTNMVSAINYDVRALDTLGEELILFVAANGAVILLRDMRGECSGASGLRIRHRRREGRSEAQTAGGRILAGVTLLFGLYVVLHAHLTPGGGFQGGTIVFSAALMVWFSESYSAWQELVRPSLISLAEVLGVAIYLIGGLIPLCLGAQYLENTLPLGQTGSLMSGGLIPVLNLGVGLAVGAGFCSIAVELIKQTREEG